MDGTALGSRYVLGPLIGKGAMGRVHRATVRSGGPDVAVKLLRDDLSSSSEVVSQFVGERDVLSVINHPNVVRVLDLVVEGDRLGIVMDLVDGGHLRCALPPPTGAATAALVVGQIARGLAAVHRVGVVHRDVKPENVLVEIVDGYPVVRLTDFGISRLVESASTRTTTVIGTPGYISPEVALGRSARPPSDVYALGVILFEWCTGRQPFRAENPVALLRAHAEDPAPRPVGMPDALAELLGAMLAKDPAERPDAEQVADRLQALTGTLSDADTYPVVDAPATLPSRSPAPPVPPAPQASPVPPQPRQGHPHRAAVGTDPSDAVTVQRLPPPAPPPPPLSPVALSAYPSEPSATQGLWRRRLPALAAAAAAVLTIGVVVTVAALQGDGADPAAQDVSSSDTVVTEPSNPPTTVANSAAQAEASVTAPSAGQAPAAGGPGRSGTARPAAAGGSTTKPKAAVPVVTTPAVAPAPAVDPVVAPVPVPEPGAVASMSLSGATQTTIDLAWGASAGATSYRLGWTESGTGRAWTSDDTEYGAGSRGVTLIGLLPGHTYTVTVTPLNASGAGPTTTRTGSTDAAPVVTEPGAVSSMSLSGATSTTLDLAWGASVGATSYRLGWTESGTDGRKWTSDDTEYGASRRGVTLIGLLSDRTYTVTVTPLNSAGTGPATSRTASTLP